MYTSIEEGIIVICGCVNKHREEGIIVICGCVQVQLCTSLREEGIIVICGFTVVREEGIIVNCACVNKSLVTDMYTLLKIWPKLKYDSLTTAKYY